MTRIFSREGVEPQVSIFLLKSVVNVVLIFGAETRVITPCMVRVPGGFQYHVLRRLTGRLPWQK